MKVKALFVIAVLMLAAGASLADEPSTVAAAEESQPLECVAVPDDAAGQADAAQGVGRKPKPPTEPGPVCLRELCKLRNNGELLYCVANVTPSCCRYKNSLDCTVVSACPEGLPIYCNGSNPGGDPPNACPGTCN